MKWTYKIFWALVVCSSLLLTACGQQRKSNDSNRRAATTFRTTAAAVQRPVASTPITQIGIEVTDVLRQIYDDGTVLHTFTATINGETVSVATNNDPYNDLTTPFTSYELVGGLHSYFQSICIDQACSYSIINVMIYNDALGESKQIAALINPNGLIPTDGSGIYEGMGSATITNTMKGIDQLVDIFFPTL